MFIWFIIEFIRRSLLLVWTTVNLTKASSKYAPRNQEAYSICLEYNEKYGTDTLSVLLKIAKYKTTNITNVSHVFLKLVLFAYRFQTDLRKSRCRLSSV